MINLTGYKIPSGDKDQVDLSNPLCKKGQPFLDDVLGLIVWDGTQWLQTGLAPVKEITVVETTGAAITEEVLPEGNEYYLTSMTKVVLKAFYNGVELTTRQNLNNKRLYGFPEKDNTAAITLLIV